MPTDAAADDLVTVVVPARNEEAAIVRCLESIEAQSHRPIEVLVVDGASDDATVATVEAFRARSTLSIRVLHNEQRSVPAALNLAAHEASSPIFVRLDAHAEMLPGYLEACVDALTTGQWAGVGGAKIPIGSTSFGRAVAIAFTTRIGSGGSYYHHGTEQREVEHIPFGAFPTYIVRSMSGWDNELLVNQDYEFDHRVRTAGGRLLFDPRIRAKWRCRNTVRALAYQYYRYGRGKAMVARRHPRSVRLRQLAPPLLPIAALVGAAAGITLGSFPAAVLVPALHAAIISTAGLVEGWRLGARGRDLALTPAAIAVMHWAWGLGFLRGLPSSWNGVDPFQRNPLVADSAPAPRPPAPRPAPSATS